MIYVARDRAYMMVKDEVLYGNRPIRDLLTYGDKVVLGEIIVT